MSAPAARRWRCRAARIGEDWVADHTHMSLFRDVPSRSFGKKPGGWRNRGCLRRFAFAAATC